MILFLKSKQDVWSYMRKIEAVRKFTFCAGHRVYGHESKCANMHGHNYCLYVHAYTDVLDELGRVIDFSLLKDLLDPWLQVHWDHTFLVYENDKELLAIEPLAPKNKPWFICPFNPTAENMAIYLMKEVFPKLLPDNIQISKIELWETENCKVVVTH